MTAPLERFDEKQLVIDILVALNRSESPLNAIEQILKIIKHSFEVSAVALRLRDGDDYPYFIYDGFSEIHIQRENYLCGHDLNGNLILDEDGQPALNCMCGLVIRGKTDPKQPFFTDGGSFWTNNSNILLSTTDEEALQTETRDFCNAQGYLSVALVPLRNKQSIIGLIQLNDKHQGKFTRQIIEFLEQLGESIGIALAHLNEKGKRKEAEAQRERLLYIYQLRLRELDTLYNISKVLQNHDLNMNEMLREIVNLLPGAMQYPETAVARLLTADSEITSENFQPSEWKISKKITVYDQEEGMIEIGYIEERPEEFKGPFLEEEVRLLDTVCKTISHLLEHQKSNEWSTKLDRFALIMNDEEVRHMWDLVQEDMAINQMDTHNFNLQDVPQVENEQIMKNWLYLKTKLELNRNLTLKLQNLLE